MQRVNIFVQRPQMFFNKTKYIGKTFPALLTQFIAYFLCVSKLYREVAILVECTQIYTVTVTVTVTVQFNSCTRHKTRSLSRKILLRSLGNDHRHRDASDNTLSKMNLYNTWEIFLNLFSIPMVLKTCSG